MLFRLDLFEFTHPIIYLDGLPMCLEFVARVAEDPMQFLLQFLPAVAQLHCLTFNLDECMLVLSLHTSFTEIFLRIVRALFLLAVVEHLSIPA